MTAAGRIDRAVTWAADGRATLHAADCSLARAAAAAGAPVLTLLDCAQEPAQDAPGLRFDRCRCLTAGKKEAP